MCSSSPSLWLILWRWMISSCWSSIWPSHFHATTYINKRRRGQGRGGERHTVSGWIESLWSHSCIWMVSASYDTLVIASSSPLLNSPLSILLHSLLNSLLIFNNRFCLWYLTWSCRFFVPRSPRCKGSPSWWIWGASLHLDGGRVVLGDLWSH